jgi:hypothetical protein
MKTREEKNEAEKQRDREITEMPRSNNYAVFGSDILLALEQTRQMTISSRNSAMIISTSVWCENHSLVQSSFRKKRCGLYG